MTKKSKSPKTKPTTDTATEPKPKKAKPQQQKLPGEGFARKGIKEIDDAAEAYRTARDTRMEYTKAEKAAKDYLLGVVKKHEAKVYIYESEDGEEMRVEYTAKAKENVRVRSASSESDDDGEADE
jgi:hypothetical protein